MAPRTPAALGRALSSASCSCTQPTRSVTARLQSTAAAASPAGSSAPPSQRVVAAALLSRPPLLLPALSPFEGSYYAYQRRIHRALSKPAESATSWFFKRGSAAEKAFTSFDQRVGKEEQKGDMVERRAYEMAGEEVEGAPELMHRETEADRVGDEHSLERRADRTLYLLLKKKRDQHAWQFPQGGVEGQESLVQAAQRELHEETGPNVDVWPVGRVPAGAYEYAFPAEHVKKFPAHAGATVFFMPMRVIRGQAVPSQKEGIVDFAWLTKEEVQKRVSPDYWQAIEPMLSDQ
ncbi:mitochondrial 54S ribosomal protein mL46 MRPL17 [Rhodotorula paludigena]|uniref:mitochondrial 54S ribosomal protein mL46 MRPL17 n=1 Tax=Rhodotorula paludigena TaxID=86838 RepID=UPI003170A103